MVNLIVPRSIRYLASVPRIREWLKLAGLAVAAFLPVVVLYRLDSLTRSAALQTLVLLGAFAATCVLAHYTSGVEHRALDLREAANGGPLSRRATLAGPRRWAMWFATLGVALAAGHLVESTGAEELRDLRSVGFLAVAVAVAGFLLLMLYVGDLARGTVTRRAPWGHRGPTREFESEPNVFGVIGRMSPVLSGLIALAAVEYAAVLGVAVALHDWNKFAAGLGLVLLTTAAVLAAPAVITASAAAVESAWRERWYEEQMKVVAHIRPALRNVRILLRAAQVAALGLLTGMPALLSRDETGLVFLVVVYIAAVAHALTRVAWLWAPIEPDADPIGAEVVKAYEPTMLRAAAILTAVGSGLSLAAILAA